LRGEGRLMFPIAAAEFPSHRPIGGSRKARLPEEHKPQRSWGMFWLDGRNSAYVPIVSRRPWVRSWEGGKLQFAQASRVTAYFIAGRIPGTRRDNYLRRPKGIRLRIDENHGREIHRPQTFADALKPGYDFVRLQIQ